MFEIRYLIQNFYGLEFNEWILFTALMISAMMDVPSSPKEICYAMSFSKLVSFPTVLKDKYKVGRKSDSLATKF